jgi:AraC family transcriptional regulator, transcriptional activator of pobA
MNEKDQSWYNTDILLFLGMGKNLPVYDISDFDSDPQAREFYTNRLSVHVASHTFTNLPHKHDFFLTILVTRGTGWHEVDFVRYKVKPGAVFLMQPGQMHYWRLSKDIEGYVFFHSKEFYDEAYVVAGIKEFPFFRSFQSSPAVLLPAAKINGLKFYCEELIAEHKSKRYLGMQKLRALVNVIYIELSREYSQGALLQKQRYLSKLNEFETRVDNNFRQIKSAGEYARMLNVSEKHLNRIVRETLDKTSTQLIADRIVLEAKRMLIAGKLSVAEIGYELGYSDKSYFARFFKKNAGETPLAFVKRSKKNSA